MFLNSSSYFYDQYSYGSGYSAASSPYYNLFRRWPNDSDNSSRPYSNIVAECNDAVVNMYSGDYSSLPAPVNAKGKSSWTGRWKVVEQSYTAWQVVITGGAAGTVTYDGSALIPGGTTTQSNNGFFVLNATPSTGDFTVSNVDGYLTDPSLTIDTDRKLIKVVYTEYATIYNTITTTLDEAPEGVGYPTTTARTRMQAAIDIFDASSKVTADLTTLNNAYSSFLPNVVLPEGKVYKILSYVKSPSKTAYFENIDGTLTISSNLSETALNNLWVVRKSGNTYVLQSAADPTKYIVYNSFTLNATGAAWTFSCGTEWPCITMYNSTLSRYIACDPTNSYFGTAVSGKNYYGSSKTQASGWSTDFKFVESDDYALYKVRIIYPSGSAPTVTYNATAYSNGSDFVAPKTLAVGDLSVSEISGYTPTVTIDGDFVYVNYNMAVAAPYADTWNFDSSPWLLLNDAPTAIDNPSRTYRYNTKRINIATTYNSSVEVVFAYSSGSYRIDVAGVDLIDPSTGNVVKGDYHDGYSGNEQSNREYSIRDVAPGNYILRYISYGQSISSAGNISVRVVPGQGFYRLKNVATGKYLTATATGAWNSSTRYVYANGSNTAASTVIRLYEKDSDGKLYMYNQGYGFGWTATNHGGGVGWITSSPDKYVNWFSGTADGRLAFAICFGNGTGNYASYLEKGIYTADTDDEAVIAGESKTADAAQWIIEPATTVTIPLSYVSSAGASFSTLYLPFGVTIEGAKAYILTVSGDYAVPHEIDEVPANTGVLLRAAGNVASVTATIKDAATAETDGNKLDGTNIDITADREEGEYILGVVDDEIGFYKRKSGKMIGANKAYLNLDDDIAGVKGVLLNFDELVDGIGLTPIDEVESSKFNVQSSKIYNLAGQRLSKPMKGINIVNGKKVMVK